jgi:hypothetical protein
VSEVVYLLLAVTLVVAYLLLTSEGGARRAPPGRRELDELFDQTAREMARAEERRRQWLAEALQRERKT